MSKIPTEIDRVIWATAESGDAKAIEEFGIRYPDFKSELVSRIQLVRAFRSSRPNPDVPAFRPSVALSRPPAGRRWLVAFAGLALGSLALASLAIIKPWASHTLNDTVAVSSNGTGSDKSRHFPVTTPAKPVKEDLAAALPIKETPPPVAYDPFSKPVSVSHDQISLVRVLKELAAKAKISLEIAPGFEDQVVSVRYSEIPVRQAFEELSQNFGFTVVQQGDSSAIAIPAVDNSKPIVTLPADSGSNPVEPTRNKVPVPTVDPKSSKNSAETSNQ